ncbi:energy-coupling factor transporter transmembrane component T family protein [Skermania piniformis]|uniref:Energy-coupling factor transporter transmembrane protein EcfT n=1 Tax=Skermania pinensis TaxID=39122 RepID=A0ABX8S5J7_9ACTN|nr:energy-coupling factor transporter transmembrane protein EcfT [Skermania piniformis]QXQ13118.1 energy-coupling factor transporter transmembrane protein EcfT [Skermania piniformis]
MSTVLLRQVPGTSVVHRLWAGTKLIGVVVLGLPLVWFPIWPVLGITFACFVSICVSARIPLTALPRLRWWFWAVLLGYGLIYLPAGLDAVSSYARLVALGLLLVGSGFLIVWTTPLNEVAPAFATLAAPLRRLRLPVDEWAVTIALCLRGLPLLVDELRLLRAARRLRPRGADRTGRNTLLADLATATLAVATRRAGELGEAITARGGTGQLTAAVRGPTWRDAVALTGLIAVAGFELWLYLVLGGSSG